MSRSEPFRLLFVADVVGRPGREAVAAILPELKDRLQPDLTIINGENSAGGFGLTAATVDELRKAGGDVITTGNHVFDQREFMTQLPELERVLRPHNYPPGAPGTGVCALIAGEERCLVVNLVGRVFMNHLDDPFRAADAVLAEHPEHKIVVVDWHCEATSEKIALGWYLDGRVSAVLGTHTHVPTADERVLPNGTAYCSDVGMVGPRDGVLGMDREPVLARFLTGVPQRWRIADGPVTFNSVFVSIDRLTGRSTAIQRIDQLHA
jgi:metallophosphoesterase (TIGR00282 family)